MWTLVDYINTTWLWWTVTVAYVAIILGVIAIVISENRNPVKSLAWITVLMVLPAVGLILYIFFGRNIQNKRIISRRNRRKLRKLEERAGLPASKVKRSPLSVRHIKLAESLQGSPYYEGNSVELYRDGQAKFDALLRDIRNARHYINIEYYIISDDHIGRQVADALIERAQNGVKVRIIYDSVGSFKTSRRFFKKLKKAGIEAFPFFEVVFPPFGTRVNWRNHRKITVIDGEIGYIGGMNIADRYIDGGKAFAMWRDLHLRVIGPGVAALQQSFATDWNFMGQPLIEDNIETEKLTLPGTTGVQLLTGGPVNQWMNLTLLFQQIISTAHKLVWLQTPYFLPTEGLLHALQTASLAKVDVRIMLPRRSDSDMLRWASFSYIQECLRAGIKVYLYDKGMLHSKAIMVDDEFATVGSTNFDFRSFEHNFEANLLIYSKEFNATLRKHFLEDQRNCVRVNPATWRKRPYLEKALESVMRLFAPIL
ncbi:MAG: cardiolipin synthase [Muribaculaceae bacterium]|nr:cardiolipin synthase [Muribaculaceae bacterium]